MVHSKDFPNIMIILNDSFGASVNASKFLLRACFAGSFKAYFRASLGGLLLKLLLRASFKSFFGGFF